MEFGWGKMMMSLSVKISLKSYNVSRENGVARYVPIGTLALILVFPLFFAGATAVEHRETYTFELKWGNYGTGYGEFNNPYDVAVDNSGNVYVADTYNHRIQKFSNEGNFIGSWGSLGSNDGQFRTPKGVAVDAEGNIYVADTKNNRVQKFQVEPRV